MPKFNNKQYGILKLMLVHFNICCLILIKIFILVTYLNFDLCSLLWYVTKNGMCDVNTDPQPEKRCDVLKRRRSLDCYPVRILNLWKVPNNLSGTVAKKPLDNDPTLSSHLRMFHLIFVGWSVLTSHMPFFVAYCKCGHRAKLT